MEKLREALGEGNFVDVSINVEAIVTVLNELCGIVAQQGQGIGDLRRDLAARVSREEFMMLRDQVRQDRESLQKMSATLTAVPTKTVDEITRRLTVVRTELEDLAAARQVTMEGRVNQRFDGLQADIQMLENRVISAAKEAAEAHAQSRRVSQVSVPAARPSSAVDEGALSAGLATLRQEAAAVREAASQDVAQLRADVVKAQDDDRRELSELKRQVAELKELCEAANSLNAALNEVTLQQPETVPPPTFETELDSGALEALETRLLQRIERKTDGNLVERMFDRLRVMVARVGQETTSLGEHIKTLPTRSLVAEMIDAAIAKVEADRPDPFRITQLRTTK